MRHCLLRLRATLADSRDCILRSLVNKIAVLDIVTVKQTDYTIPYDTAYTMPVI